MRCASCSETVPESWIGTDCPWCSDPHECDRSAEPDEEPSYYADRSGPTLREQYQRAHEMDRNPNDPRW